MEVKNSIKKIINRFTNSSKILVTGGTGYIGSHTVVELIKEGYEIYIIDNLYNSTIDVLNGIEKITGVRPVYENIDCTDYVQLDKFFKKYEGINAIIHFAALKSVNESVDKPLPYYRNNIVSLVNLLELMPIHKIENIVFSSSCAVYGQPDTLPVNEQSPRKQATSPYGNTKKICEDIIFDTTKSNKDIHSIILRYFNPIGSHPSALIGELPNGVPNNLVPYITQTAAGIHKKLTVFGDDYNTPDGSCIRDYISVTDLAKAHVSAMKRLLSQPLTENEVYNIGTGKGFSVLELIHLFEEACDVKVPYEIGARRSGDIEQVWADAQLANKVLKWKPKESIEDTLRSAWKWQQYIMNKTEDNSSKGSSNFSLGGS